MLSEINKETKIYVLKTDKHQYEFEYTHINGCAPHQIRLRHCRYDRTESIEVGIEDLYEVADALIMLSNTLKG